jgi:hypothetical protein
MFYEMDKPQPSVECGGNARLPPRRRERRGSSESEGVALAGQLPGCCDSAGSGNKERGDQGQCHRARSCVPGLIGCQTGLRAELFAPFMWSRGVDIQRDTVQVQVHHHTSNGSIRIDSDAKSRVASLFAAGEAAGWQGADRLWVALC